MKHVYNDGGRAAAGYKGHAGDCGCRAVSIAMQRPYQEVYDELNAFARDERVKKGQVHSSARNGYHSKTMGRYLASKGWTWTPTMGIGTGCKVHLTDGELPNGRLIVRLSKHYTTVIDGVIHDTHDPQWTTINVVDGVEKTSQRCVYGYWHQATTSAAQMDAR